LKTPHTGRRFRTTTSVVTWVRIPYTLLKFNVIHKRRGSK
jgi:hypothetical protein